MDTDSTFAADLMCIWKELRESDELDRGRLLKLLQRKHQSLPGMLPSASADYWSKVIEKAVLARLIHAKEKEFKLKTTIHYSLPKFERAQRDPTKSDRFCYECHRDGVVIPCQTCNRSFHQQCIRSLELVDRELNDFKRNKRRQRSSVDISFLARPKIQNHQHRAENVPPPPVSIASPPPMENRTTPDIKWESDVKQEEEVLYVGVVRKPYRRLEGLQHREVVKPEVVSGNTENVDDTERNMTRMCTVCRSIAANRDCIVEGSKREELNYALMFVISSYCNWLTAETYLAKKADANDRYLMPWLQKLLLRSDISVQRMAEKVIAQQYNSIIEFLIDTLDIAHNMAVLYGDRSQEHEIALYFATDCGYDLSEIRICMDCYRHSNERQNDHWFARPCTMRHELVFAKQSGCSYWPAKIIRMMHGKYDVRYFADYSRALVDENCVKPIDTDPKTFKVGARKVGFQRAMHEMLLYQTWIEQPKVNFQYNKELRTVTVTDIMTRTFLKRNNVKSRRSMIVPEGGAHVGDEEPSPTANNQIVVRRTQRSNKKKTMDDSGESPTTCIVITPKRKRKNASTAISAISEIVPLISAEIINHSTSNGTPETSYKQLSMANHVTRSRTRSYRSLEDSDDTQTLDEQFQQFKTVVKSITDINVLKQFAISQFQAMQKQQERMKVTAMASIGRAKKLRWCAVCGLQAHLECCFSRAYCSRKCKDADMPTHRENHGA